VVCRLTLTLLGLFLAVPGVANASVLYTIAASFEESGENNLISVSGQIGFMGDLSTDGVFPLVLSDLTAFDVTVSCSEQGSPGSCFPDVIYDLSDVFSIPLEPEYKAAGGELVEIDILASANGSSIEVGWPDFTGTTHTLYVVEHSTANHESCNLFNDLCDGPYTLARVPEPTTALLFACGLVALGAHRRLHPIPRG